MKKNERCILPGCEENARYDGGVCAKHRVSDIGSTTVGILCKITDCKSKARVTTRIVQHDLIIVN